VHIEQKPTLKMVLKYMDRSFTVIFFLEMIVKQGAYGFKKYFTDAWCWLDFIIVAVSRINYTPFTLRHFMQYKTSLCSASSLGCQHDTARPTFAAERRAATPLLLITGACYRSTCPARGALSSKPTARRCCC